MNMETDSDPVVEFEYNGARYRVSAARARETEAIRLPDGQLLKIEDWDPDDRPRLFVPLSMYWSPLAPAERVT